MPETPERLKKRTDFTRVAGGRKWIAPGLVLQARAREGAAASGPGERAARVGFTVSRRVGCAVERNRVKRRLRSLASEVLAPHAAPATDYVLIGRRAALTRPYAALRQDLKQAIQRIDSYREKGERAEP